MIVGAEGAEGAAGECSLMVGAEGVAPEGAPDAGVSLMVRFASFAVSVETGAEAAGAGATAGVIGVAGAVAGPESGLPDCGTSLMVRLASFAVSVETGAASAAGAGAGVGVTGDFSFNVGAEAAAAAGPAGFSRIVLFGIADPASFSSLSAMIMNLLHDRLLIIFYILAPNITPILLIGKW